MTFGREVATTTPAHAPGFVDVVVTNPDDQRGTLANSLERSKQSELLSERNRRCQNQSATLMSRMDITRIGEVTHLDRKGFITSE